MAEWKKVRKFQSAKVIPDVDDLKDNPFTATVISTFSDKYFNDALRENACNSLWAFTNHLTQNYNKPRYKHIKLPKSSLKRVNIPYSVVQGTLEEYFQNQEEKPVEYKITNYWVNTFLFEDFMHDILKTNNITISSNKYQYQDDSQVTGTVTIDGELYGFSGFTGNTYGATEGFNVELHYYKTTAIGGPNTQYITETFTKSFATPYWNSKHDYLYIQYKTSPSDYWIACIDIDAEDSTIKNYIETAKGAQYLPVITLRSGYKAVDDPTCRMHKLHSEQKDVLRRVANVDYDSLIDQINARGEGVGDDYKKSLENIISAHIAFMVDVTDRKSKVVAEYYYRYFYWLARTTNRGSGGVERYDAGEYQYMLKWDSISVYTKKTRLPDNRKYEITKDRVPNPNYRYNYNPTQGQSQVNPYDNYLVIKHQIQADTVRVIKVKNPIVSHRVEYAWVPHNIHDEWDNDEEGRFLIPIQNQILRKMGYVRGTLLLQYSMLVIFQVYKAVKKKWYQSTWFLVFRIVLIIIAIICQQWWSLPMLIGNAVLNVVIWILISLSIALATKYTCKILNVPEWVGTVHNIVAAIVVSFFNPVLGANMMQMNAMGQSALGMIEASRSGDDKAFLNSVIGMFSSMVGNPAASGLSMSLQIANMTVANPNFYAAIDNKDWVSLGITAVSVGTTLNSYFSASAKAAQEASKIADNSVATTSKTSSTNPAKEALKQAKKDDLFNRMWTKILIEQVPAISMEIANSRTSQQTLLANQMNIQNSTELEDILQRTKELDDQIDEYCTGANYVNKMLAYNKNFTPDMVTRFLDANSLISEVNIAKIHNYAENVVRVQHGSKLAKDYQLFSPRVGYLV